ncbi:TnsA endonuclease N-terminal domain-containing protein [Spiribacter halobius]|uniref:TnsA endonuclease N-terminal domain-containing protein n=1 Tax=Sediminicurvatus halobius TaxID=2182432 RepID=A0A2U2N2B8_9GAMM|nr:TnsA endonuclease N-terminal domain-containing protein [Spiribacter halobius]PWG63361.1 hypothetical protein DEM34_08615 [Spiribacter halobius]UEX78031.1 TnsA endonuclease N-terminal domain-containing protein [Spiribacter halobius]
MKRMRGATPARRDRWVEKWRRADAEGRYEPFLNTQDVRSNGTRGRIPSLLCPGRIYHLMSHSESLYVCRLERDPRVVAIREQYPLLPVVVTVDIADRLEIRHPRYPASSTYIVMTSDFLVDRVDGGQEVHSVKAAYALEKPRTREKLLVEETYWRDRGIGWRLITDLEIRTQENGTLLLLHGFAQLRQELVPHRDAWLWELGCAIDSRPYLRVAELIDRACEQTGLEYRDGVHILYHALWWRLADMAFEHPLRLEHSAEELELVVHACG